MTQDTTTYTMRGETYTFEPPTDSEAISRLVWLANNRGGDWATAAIQILKAVRDAERVITLPSGQRWKVEGVKLAGAATTTWKATRLAEAVEQAITDEGLLAKIAGGQELTLGEADYLAAVADGRWHDLPLQGSQTTPRQVRVNRWTKNGLDRLYVELRISSTNPRGANLGFVNLQTGAVTADDSRHELAAAVAAILAGSQLTEDAAIDREAADIRRVQALVLAARPALEAQIAALDAEVERYSFRSKSQIKGSKVATSARLSWALVHATADVETLAAPQIATLYAVARSLEG